MPGLTVLAAKIQRRIARTVSIPRKPLPQLNCARPNFTHPFKHDTPSDGLLRFPIVFCTLKPLSRFHWSLNVIGSEFRCLVFEFNSTQTTDWAHTGP